MNKKAYILWTITCLTTGFIGWLSGTDKTILAGIVIMMFIIQLTGGILLVKHHPNGTKIKTAVMLFIITVIPISITGKMSAAASIIPLLYGYSGNLKDEYEEPCIYNWKQVLITVALGALTVFLNNIVIYLYKTPIINNMYADIVLICGIMAQVAILFKEEKNKNKQLEKNVDTVRKESNIDALTGLFNRKLMEEFITSQMKSIQAFSVIIMDIDNFKKVNDTYGHAFGDEVLKGLAVVLKSTIRNEDMAFRYGGEEFVIVCPSTAVDKGFGIAERIRIAFNKHPFVFENEELHFSISLGVSQSTYMQYETPVEIIKNSDAALYKSKKTGKNKVTIFTEAMKEEQTC